MCCKFVRELSLKPGSNMIHSHRNQSPSSGKVAAKYRTLLATFKDSSVLNHVFFCFIIFTSFPINFSSLACTTFLLLLFCKRDILYYWLLYISDGYLKTQIKELIFSPCCFCLKKSGNFWNRVSVKYKRVKLSWTGFPKSKLLSNSENEYLHSSLTQCREVTNFREVSLMAILIERGLGKEHARQVYSSFHLLPHLCVSIGRMLWRMKRNCLLGSTILLRGCKETGVKSGMCGELEWEHSILLLADVC